MVLINNLTIDEINAALLHLQRARTEVVGGTKGSTVQNITISNKGGGSTVDYAPTITALSNRIDKNTDDIESVEGEIDKIQATLEQLSNNGISSMTFDPISRQLQINTQDGEVYSCDITSENIILNFDATTNKLTLEMGEQYQEVTLPYINANEKGSANGVATLDSSGRVPYSQLPESAMEFLGQWNASTNTPHLEDGTGTNGDFYVCNVGGTVTFGTGNTQTFVPNDRVIYNGATSQWIKLPAGQVSSVNGMSGDVTLTASNIEYSTGVSIKAKIDTLGTAAYCNADCFRPSSWTPSCVSCAGVSYTTCVNYTGSYNGNFDLALLVTNPRNCIYQASCSNYRATFNPNSGQLTAPYIQLGTGCATQGAGTIYGQGTYANYALICLLNNTSGIWGNGVSIGGGGIVIVGSGESASTVWTSLNGSGNLYGGAAGCESTFITADDDVYLFSNVQNGYACRKVAYLDTSGVFHADSFCGTVSYANCAEEASFANCVCKTKYSTSCNCDLNVMMVSSVPGSSNDFAQGYAQGCCLTYNPSTGQLRLKSNGKTACISHISCSYLHIYTDAPGIAFNQDIWLPDGKYICRAKEACYVRDRKNGKATYLAYGCACLSSAAWLAAWNGYELRAVSPSVLHVACADHATVSGIETYEGTYCCGWTWIGSCMSIWELFPQFFHVSLRGSTCQGNIFQSLCAFICSRDLTEKSGDSCHYIHGSGAVRLNNGCHASLCAISYFKCNLGGDISWIAVCGTESYFVFYKDCVCSSCICCFDFYFGS